MLRTLTLWLYCTAVALGALLSDGPLVVRAGASGLWTAATVRGLACCLAGLARAARARRGWTWLEAGRCSRCAYPVHRSFLVCPECGGRVGSPPGGSGLGRGL